MIVTADGFSYNGARPNFERDLFATKQEMNDYIKEYALDEGHLSYCTEDKKHYKYNGTEWEEFKTGSDSKTDISVDEESHTLIINTIIG